MSLLLGFGAAVGLSVASGELGRVSVFGYYAGAWAERGPLAAQVFAESYPSRGEGVYRVSLASLELGGALRLGVWRLSAGLGPGLVARQHLHASDLAPLLALNLSAGLFSKGGPGGAALFRAYPGRESLLLSFGLGFAVDLR